MKAMATIIGAAIGGWRRGLPGAVLGGAAGWGIGWLLTSSRRAAAGEEEDHYLRYPEEEMVDALVQVASDLEAEAAELEELYRSVCAARGFVPVEPAPAGRRSRKKKE